jgi:hypothetical protein
VLLSPCVSPCPGPTVSQINNLLGVNLYDVLSFRADVAIDFDEYGRVLKTELLNPAARTSIGPDSERIREAEQVIADALTEVWTTDQHEHWPEYIATALRAAGLLPGPDDIVVSREALTELWDVKAAVDGLRDAGVLDDDDTSRVTHLPVVILPPVPREPARLWLVVRPLELEESA